MACSRSLSQTVTNLAGECQEARPLASSATEGGVPLGVTALKVWTRPKFRGTPRSSGWSTRPGCRSRARRVSDGSTTCDGRSNFLESPALVHVGDGEATSTSCSVSPGTLGRTSSSAPVLTGPRRRNPHHCGRDGGRPRARPAPGSPSRAGRRGDDVVLSSGPVASTSFHRLASSGVIPPWTSLSCTSPSGIRRADGHHRVEAPDGPAGPVARGRAGKVRWYAMRWKIETFHKILKSGCRAEEPPLLSAERIANLLTLFCIIAWRMWLPSHIAPTRGAAPQTALSERDHVSSIRTSLISVASVPKRHHWPSTSAARPPRRLSRPLT